jgi:asparagine synthase (glutamine-hydrolysing)
LIPIAFIGAISTDLSPRGSSAPPGLLQGEKYHCVVSRRSGGYAVGVWGNVPFAESGDQFVLLSGSLFNAADLGAQLSTNPLNSASLLLEAYCKWGDEFPKYVEGVFAFALWDGPARRLLLGRDSSGHRTLFYTQNNNGLVFASDIRTLQAWPELRLRADENHVAHWLATIPTGTHSTFFQDVSAVPPGHTVRFENSRVSLNAFWQPENLPLLRLRDSREYADGLREVLRTAIRDRLQPDSPAASQMSGGLDSSTVAALTAGILQKERRRLFAFTAVPAFPVTIPGRFCDEGPHAASVAAMYPNVDHVLVRHGSHSYFTLMDRFGAEEGQPILNPANYDWIYEIALQARSRGVESLLTGSLGNFTISYDGEHALASLLHQGRLLKAAALAGVVHRNQNRRWLGIAHQLLRPFTPEWARSVLDYLRGEDQIEHEQTAIRPEFARSHGLDPRARERHFHGWDARSFCLSGLRRVDLGPFMEGFWRMSGVSMTDPTSDKRVVEYCLSVPTEFYCQDGVPRSLIRNAMAGLLPDMVRTERRKGLQAADSGEIFRPLRQEAFDEIARMKKVDLVARAWDLPAVESMMHWSESQIAAYGTSMYWTKLMRVLSLGRFLRRLEDGSLFTVHEEHDAQVSLESTATPTVPAQ